MFNNIGYKIKIMAVVLATIAFSVAIICVIAGFILVLEGKFGSLALKCLLAGIVICILAYFFSLLIYGFGHNIEVNEEQAISLRRIVNEENGPYKENIFVE